VSDQGERWRAIEALFYRALEQDPPNRDRFLDQSCAGDAELRHEVASLLAAAEAAGGSLESSIEQTIRRTAAEAVMPTPTRRVGRYRLIREIGHGGMGVVYLAERADGEYEQRVAIKLVKGHVAGEEARRRFLIERQILARLEHPAIARLLDGGTTGDGTPYLVMEYVDGDRIDDWCRTEAVAVEQRLQLFLRVCDAVESAHRQLIVHRDLKPSNILVTRDGRPQLLDFGVAKLLDDDETGATHTGERRLTPAYASPEQALGRPITTATDVYSLGAVLYELLAGRPAFAAAELTPAQILDAICTETPPRPSLAADQGDETTPDRRRLRGRLEGELDAIVMTALRKEPERRYASVAALAEDLRRHLAGLPVAAHSERWSYLAGKWLSRHRLAVGAAVVALASLLGGLFLATRGLVEARRANRELAAANQETVRESEKLSAVNEFLIDMLSASGPGQQGATVKVVDLLGPAAERLPEVYADQPEVAAALTETLGQAYLPLGLLDEAEEVLRQGRAAAAERLGPSSAETLRLERGLAATLLHRERFAEAAELLSAGMARRENVLGTDHEETIQAQLLLAELLDLMGRPEQAEGLVRRVLDQRVASLGANHPDTLEAVHALGGLFEATDREAEATELFEREVAGRRQLLDPDDLATAYPLASAMDYLSASLEARGMRREAMQVRREVVDLMRRVEAPPDRIAQSLSNLGVSFEGEGRFGEAAALYREALSELSEVDADHPGRLLVLSNLGDALLASGRLPEAISAYREVVAGSRRTLGPEHSKTTLTRVRLARALARDGECDEALEIFRRTGQIDPEESLYVWLRDFRGVLHAAALFRCGDDSGAEKLLGPSVDELLRTAAPTPFLARDAIGEVIEVFEARGDGTRADELRALLEAPGDRGAGGQTP